MKTIIPIMVLFLAVVSINYGQESRLVLTKKSNKRELYLPEGSSVKIKLDEYTFVKGTLKVINNTTITVGGDTIPVGKIYSVGARMEKRKKSGTKLIISGAAGLLLGTVLYSDAASSSGGGFLIDFSNGEGKAGLGLIALGAGMTTYGILQVVTGRIYKGSSWDFSIRRATSILE